MSSRIESFIHRVTDDDYFLASALEDYVCSEQVDDTSLAMSLGCSLEALDSLRLCRRPRPEPTLFRRDTDRIASRFAVNAEVLAQIVRRSNAVRAMRRGNSEQPGLLMAARDVSENHSTLGEAGEDSK